MKFNVYLLVAILGSASHSVSAGCCLAQSGECPTGFVKNNALSALPTLNLGDAIICNDDANCSIGSVSQDAEGKTSIEGVPDCSTVSADSTTDTTTSTPAGTDCAALLQQALGLATSPSCALVRAIFTGADTLAGTPEEASAVCDASPSCVDELEALVNEASAAGCDYSGSIGMDMTEALGYGSDVKALTGFFCTDNCYAETKAVAESGSTDAATCPCIAALEETVPQLSDDAKEFLGVLLGVDDAFLAEMTAASEAKNCAGGDAGDGATSSAGRSGFGVAAALVSLAAAKVILM